MAEVAGYQTRMVQEQRFFKGCEDVHSLPEIFHYWSNKYILPKLQAIGFQSSIDFLVDPIQWQCERNPGRLVRCFSLGSGNCDQEIRIALELRVRGYSEFKIECLDLNETMLERGLASATEHGIADNFIFTSGDFNSWRPVDEYDTILAIQSLHHVVELEHLFAGIHDALKSSGAFVVSDMIGRNGHLRWPEALSIVQEFWRKLPPSYRYNHQLERYEEEFENWDCSNEGFEGIRSQDILPLLNSNFHFQRFLAFGNVIDPFVERTFGHNFDAAAEWDRAFIDAVHRRDEEELRQGSIKPTHLWAILGKQDNGPKFEEPCSPSFCIRWPSSSSPASGGAHSSAYNWEEYPHDKGKELQIACARLAEAERRIAGMAKDLQTLQAANTQVAEQLEDRTAWAHQLDREVQERTAWAQRLDGVLREREGELRTLTESAVKLDEELRTRTEWALKLNEELRARTEWALKLEEEVRERTEWAFKLDEAVRTRTEWALQLERDIQARTEWAHKLDGELKGRTEWALTLVEELRASNESALRLDRELEDRTKWALQLDKELMALRTSLGRSGHVALRVIESLRKGLKRMQGRGNA